MGSRMTPPPPLSSSLMTFFTSRARILRRATIDPAHPLFKTIQPAFLPNLLYVDGIISPRVWLISLPARLEPLLGHVRIYQER